MGLDRQTKRKRNIHWHHFYIFTFKCSFDVCVEMNQSKHNWSFSLHSLLWYQGDYTDSGSIRDCAKAITPSLQILRGAIGYDIAWKWLGAGKAVSQAQPVSVTLTGSWRDKCQFFSAVLEVIHSVRPTMLDTVCHSVPLMQLTVYW